MPEARKVGRSPWVPVGDSGGELGGPAVDEDVARCTAIEMSTCRQQAGVRRPTCGQHVDFGRDLRRGPRSPASTPVMTRMRDRDREFLEPQSGWGSCALVGLAGLPWEAFGEPGLPTDTGQRAR